MSAAGIIFWSCLTILCAVLLMVAACKIGAALCHAYIHRTHNEIACPVCHALTLEARPMSHRRI